MGTAFLKQAAKFLRDRRRRRNWQKMIICLALVVSMLTTYVLIMPAITMERTPICGHEEHTHTDECYRQQTARTLSCTLQVHSHTSDCYDMEGRLVCGYGDYVIHTHDAYCYDEAGNLVCTLPEVKEHIHDQNCYSLNQVLTCQQQESGTIQSLPAQEQPAGADIFSAGEDTAGTFTDEESVFNSGDNQIYAEGGHTHTDECYSQDDTPICGLTETVAHTHTDECYDFDGNLICGRLEVQTHQHDESCFRDTALEGEENRVLVCGMEEHAHTEECYPHAEPEETVESELIDDSAPSDDQNEDITGEDITSGEDDGNTEFSEMPEDGADAEDGDAAEVPGADEGNADSETPEADEENAGSEAPEADVRNADSETPGADGENSDVEAERNGEDNTEAEFQEEDQTDEEILETPEDHENNSDSGDETTPEYICGLEEHTHGEECYDEEGNLICELEEHMHTEECVSAEVAAEEPAEEEEVPEYICGLEEHVHGEECYDEEGNLICELEEHTHTEECVPVPEDEPEEEEDIDCFDELYICGKEEHTHSEECYDEEGNLICGLEEHIHDETCLAAEDETVTLQAEGENVRAAATFAKGVLPDETTMRVAPVEQSEEEMALLKENAKSRGYDVLSAHSYDVSFLDADGEEIEPEGEVSVSIEFINPIETEKGISVSEENDLDSFGNDGEASDGFSAGTEEVQGYADSAWEFLHIDASAQVENKTDEEETVIDTDDKDSVRKITFTSNAFSIYTLMRVAAIGDGDPVWTEVATADQFRAAFANKVANIKLTDDVIIGGENINLAVEENETNREITLDLNGHTITGENITPTSTGQAKSVFDIRNGISLRILDSAWSAEEFVVKTEAEDGIPASAEFNRAEKKLTYYVMDSTASSTRGATIEKTYQYVVTGQGMITAQGNLFYITDGGSLTLQSGMITGDERSVYMDGGTLNLDGGYICGNVPGADVYGGAIWAVGGTINQSGTVLAANSAEVGGAIYAQNADINITGGVISGNIATGAGDSYEWAGQHHGGGGIFCSGTAVDINGDPLSVVNMEGGYLTCNTALTGTYFNGGGGALLAGNTRFNFSGGYITGNYTNGTGGGLYTDFGDSVTVTMTGGYVSGNYAKNAEGGGISIDNGNTGYIYAGHITNNETATAGHWGGGGLFCADGAYLYMTGVLVVNNDAGGFGGGVAGCSTGRVYICIDDGGAIFDNSAAGKNGSNSDSVKPEDWTYAFNSEVFMKNGYADYFCALNSVISGKMLGEGAANWHGSADGQAVSAGRNDTLEANYVMGLTAAPSEHDKNAANMHAAVFVNGNRSNTHGGGILCNGYLIMGTPETVELGSGLELSGQKVLIQDNGQNADALTPGAFHFTLTDENGRAVAVGTNDEYGQISFDKRLSFNREGTYTYYLKEDELENASVMTDSTEYKITVTVMKDVKNIGANIQRVWYKISEIKTEKKIMAEADGNQQETWEVVKDTIPNPEEQHAFKFAITKNSTFVNYEISKKNIKVVKKWANNNPGASEVTVKLMQNGEEYACLTLNEGNDWTGEWRELPLKDDKGTPYDYSVEEVPVEGYLTEYSISEIVEGSNYWVPAESLKPGGQYIIVDAEKDYALLSQSGNENVHFTSSDKSGVNEAGTSFPVEGMEYESWFNDEEIQPGNIYIAQSYKRGNTTGIVLKNKELESWLLVEESNNHYLKGTTGVTWASLFSMQESTLVGELGFEEVGDKYTVCFQNDMFDASAGVGSSQAVKLYTLIYGLGSASEVVTITNTPVKDMKYSLDLLKVSKEGKIPLSGAKFELRIDSDKDGIADDDTELLYFVQSGSSDDFYRVCDSSMEGAVSSLETGTNGKLFISGIDLGNYVLVETQAPEGYDKIDTQIVVDGKHKTISKTIEDPEQKYNLPNTGGNGTYRYTIGGLLLMMAAAMYKLIQLRKEVK
ncbi:MAG: SpaA isopeptide-forming pilin-related protein [Eubacteriales bacterium]|nr:SpaA isopeptide-forming pilin-related protein [Eubacteriales bacterium]